ncbi:MAG: glutamate-1-semialdehyde 2,1-aminomutase [Dysgonamonadaceae bacterium]|jgi:glutamate-1-semialdehyde 2,1-aminomutase|nr:glutamate-1-semialdehyde 2,1-aminomutase [Dysgonamonadaceae bacterium]
MNREQSKQAYEEALQFIPGGVNSPVRALKSVGEQPLFIRKADGTELTDVDGNHFTDFCLSWGVFILGHNHPQVNKAVVEAVANGTSYGIPSLPETELARHVCSSLPGVERVRFVSSGTEAVMSAVRLARGFTNRSLVVKFDGCYHGHVDHLLVAAGSGAANLASASSAGVPAGFAAHTISLPFNDRKAVENLFREKGRQIAAVIVEPVPANMGVINPAAGFLLCLRELTAKYNALLIFDEVITGFRLSLGGAQETFGVTPDLTTVGKIVGGGFPAAAFGGRADIMSLLAPDGAVYQAGTLSGNPVAMSAGIAVLQLLLEEGFYDRLNRKAGDFIRQLENVVAGKGVRVNSQGSMFTLFFSDGEVKSFEDAKQTDRERFGKFFRYMLQNRFYISPSPFEACFVSVAHSDGELCRFIDAVGGFLAVG